MFNRFYNRAEQETKAKLAKVDDIKKINAQMMAIKSEISKYEDTLKEYQLYKKFLESLTPRVIWNNIDSHYFKIMACIGNLWYTGLSFAC